MATRNTDVNLIIRARNEADQAIKAAAGALKGLFGEVDNTSEGVAALVGNLATLDRTFGTINAKADAGAAAFQRQQTSIAANQAQLKSLIAQAGAAGAAAEKLREKIVDAVLAGEDQTPLVSQIKQVEQQQAALVAQAEKLKRSIMSQDAALAGSRSSLQQLGSTVIAVEQAQEQAAARIALTTQALDQQAAAAVRVSDVQKRINALTGVDRPASRGSASVAASALLEADNIFRRAEARSAEIQKLREQEAATAALADAERAETANRARLNISNDPRGAQARESAAAFIDAADAEDQMEREAVQLRAALDPLAAIQERYNVQLARYRELAKAGKLGTDELARAEQNLAREANEARAALERVGNTGRGASGKPALFGLKPYELQNLSYQINDVFTQIASGTSITQTAAQQSGQILQLFPRLGGQIVGALKNPAIASFVATLGAIVVGLKEASNQAQRLREFTATLDLRADAGGYDPRVLSAQADALERMGVKAKEANAAVKTFLDESVDPARIAQFSAAAKATATILGTDLPTAAKEVATAFTGGYQAIAEFDDKLNFLTASEREHIRELFESGKAEAARTEALNLHTKAMEGAASKQKGPWQQAARSLGNAWDAMIKKIADSDDVKTTISILNELAGAVKFVADAVDKTLSDDAPAAKVGSARLAAVQTQITQLERQIADYEKSIAKGSPVAGTLNRLAEHAKRRLAEARAELTKLEATAGDTINSDENNRESKVRADRLAQIDLEQQIQDLRRRGQDGLNSADSRRRAQLAGELAFRAEILATGDAIVANRLREVAAAEEVRKVDQENEAARKREREVQFALPVDGPITSGFGRRARPTAGASADHRAIDFAGKIGDRVSASADGVVIETGYDKAYGKFVLIDHGNKVQSKYSHLSNNSIVAEGKPVTQGQAIGKVGQTGVATGPHLHYEVFVDGQKVNPLQNGRKFTIKPGGVNEDIAKADADRAEKQERLTHDITQEADARGRALAALRAQVGLYGTALLGEQRRQAVAQAEFDLREKVENANQQLKPGQPPLTVSDEAIANAQKLAGELFDAQNRGAALRARLEDVQRPLQTAQTEAGLLSERFELLRSLGNDVAARGVGVDLDGVIARLGTATEQAVAFYKALTPDERVELGIINDGQLDNLIAQLRQGAQQARIEALRARTEASRDEVQRPLDDIGAQIGILEERFDLLRSINDDAGAGVALTQIDAANQKLQDATAAAIAFYRALTPDQRTALGILDQTQLDNVIADLRLAGELANVSAIRRRTETRREDIQEPLDDLEAQAAVLREQIEFLRQAGDIEGVEVVSDQLDGVNAKIQTATDLIIAFYESLTPEERNALGVTEQQVDNIIDKLKVARARSQEWGRVLGISAKDIASAFGSAASNAITNFINKVAEGKSVFKSLGEGVREFAASFLSSIAQMIVQLLVYAAAVSILRALGVPVPATTGAGVFHGGGIAGQSGGVRRQINPAIFAGAMRMHTGGVVGFKPNEVPIIAERGEEILTRSDARHRANGGLGGGGSGAPQVNLKVVNGIDAADITSKGLNTPAGTRVLLNVLRANKGAAKAILSN